MNRIFQQSIFALILMLAISSCRSGFEGDRDGLREDLESITEVLHVSFFEFDVVGGTETEEFRVDNDGLHGIYGISRMDAERMEGNSLALFRCIRVTEPSVPQLTRIRAATSNFSDCRTSKSLDYRRSVNEILRGLSQNRRELIQAMQTGVMSPLEVRNEFNQLRQQARRAIMDEKIKHSETLKECLGNYVGDLNSVLTPLQWEQFRSCIRD
ncbi:hypothetical protein [Mongoliitalea daihaiensis]|uniref:hypothetical protein n=1 Tax=Mongoliitalea daihaiensis TaxID=2782006 RepID=UPI001F2A4732|nr:hypothetical protein [Mongoliitalea daihaiensis]UJP64143.1 hypothetical protein IPZ59_15180 [Mongoliitalea daihaiensis]